MTHPLINRLTEDLGWPRLDDIPAVDAYQALPGDHCLLVTGDPARNLESADAAIILPEVVKAFTGAFDCAVVGQDIERAVRERFEVWPTPSLIFLRDGDFLGAIPKIRDWDDYLDRTRLILSGRTAA